MAPIRPELAAILGAGYPGCRVEGMAGDASTRRFYRIRLPGEGTRVVMDYGAPFTGETDDVALARIFREAGLPVARILESHPDPGCLVLEDLGEVTLEDAVAGDGTRPTSGPSADELYRRATDLASDVGKRGSPVLARSPRSGGPALDASRFRFEVDFFLEHFVQGLRRERSPDPALRSGLHALADRAAASPVRVLCHRDYHSRNLVVRVDGSLAMVDIQDARWGPDAYDLASLLRDAYLDVPEPLVERMVERFAGCLPDHASPSSFRARFDIVAGQRMIKALGTFGYQATVRENPRYLEGVPRTLERLARLLPAREGTAEVGERLLRAGLLQWPGV